jgi:Flp pilus assembly protein TadG
MHGYRGNQAVRLEGGSDVLGNRIALTQAAEMTPDVKSTTGRGLMPMRRSGPAGGERGQILILTALSMTVLLGITALSIDASYMYDMRNRLHAAADAAAKSAAMELRRGNGANMQAFAEQQVSAHGFTPSSCGSTGVGDVSLCLYNPPLAADVKDPSFASSNYVEAKLSRKTSTFFAKVLGFANMSPGALAVAGTSNNLGCIITLGSSGTPPNSLEVGNSVLTLNGCNAEVGGSLNAYNPNSTINGAPIPSVGVVGPICAGCSDCLTPTSLRCIGKSTLGAPMPSDPLLRLVAPVNPNPGGCAAGVTPTLPPGCYTSIASSVNTLTPGGIYYVTGPVNFGNNHNLTGTEVMIYLTGSGAINAGNNSGLHLKAPTSGPYTGIAIFQDPTDHYDFTTGNSFVLDVDGAIYMPGADVNISNHLNFAGTNCTLFIAHSLHIANGSGQMTNAGCASTFGGAAFLSVSIAQ